MSVQDTRSNRTTPVVPTPHHRFLADIKHECCGHVSEDIRIRRESTSGTKNECPNCGEERVETTEQNLRQLIQFCENCMDYYALDNGCDCSDNN